MSTPLFAEICIGGTLPASLVPDFVTSIRDDYYNFNVSEDIKELTDAHTMMAWLNTGANKSDGRPYIGVDGSLLIVNPEARYGEFSELETFCFNNNLSYIRTSSGGGEIEPEVAWWVPGMIAPNMNLTDSCSNAWILKMELTNVMKIIEEFRADDAPLMLNQDYSTNQEFLAAWSLKNTWDKWEALKAWTEHVYPETPDSTGAFKIV